ncbi:hypothetical protein [Chryseobacterium indoltheticum]|nr:hypothetical protein [Chryseobacterium indoltheticum]
MEAQILSSNQKLLDTVFSKPTRSDVLFTRYENGFVSSSVFLSAA